MLSTYYNPSHVTGCNQRARYTTWKPLTTTTSGRLTRSLVVWSPIGCSESLHWGGYGRLNSALLVSVRSGQSESRPVVTSLLSDRNIA